MNRRGLMTVGLIALALLVVACGGGKPTPTTTFTASGTIEDEAGEPIEGVELTFAGMTATVTTDADGKWSRSGLTGSVTVIPAHDEYTFDPKQRTVTKASPKADFTGKKDAATGLAVTIAADALVVPVGGPVTLTATLAGEEAAEAEVTWTVVPDAGTFDPATGEETEWVAPAQAGEYTIKAVARAGEHVAEDELTVKVEPELRVEVTVDSTAIEYGDWVDLSAAPFGFGADEATMTWSVTPHDDPDNVGVFSDTEGRDVGWTTLDGAQTYTLTATAEAFGESASATVDVTVSDPCEGIGNCFLIRNLEDLRSVGDGASLGAHHIVITDLDAEETRGWSHGGGFPPIGSQNEPFDGTFDGRGHEIRNLFIDRPTETGVGLFGAIGGGARIEHVVLTDVDIEGGDDVGGLVGYVGYSSGCEDEGGHCDFGTVGNVTVTGDVKGLTNVGGLVGQLGGFVSGSVSGADVDGGDNVGGFVGKILGVAGEYGDTPVAHSHSTGYVTGIDNVGGFAGSSNAYIEHVYSVSDVEGQLNVGGLIGYQDSEGVRFSYSLGNVQGQENVGGLTGFDDDGGVNDSYSTGNVTGENNVGGLVGKTSESTVEDSHSTSDVIGEENVGGLIGSVAEYGGAERTYSTGHVDGKRNVGGLIGYERYGTVEYSYSTATVVGDDNVGGLVGYSDGVEIADSYGMGEVTGGTNVGGLVGFAEGGEIRRTFSSGLVSGDDVVGGLVGKAEGNPDDESSYWDTETSEQAASAVGDGHATEQMMQQATYDGWDFDDVWTIDEEVDYPDLKENLR